MKGEVVESSEEWLLCSLVVGWGGEGSGDIPEPGRPWQLRQQLQSPRMGLSVTSPSLGLADNSCPPLSYRAGCGCWGKPSALPLPGVFSRCRGVGAEAV